MNTAVIELEVFTLKRPSVNAEFTKQHNLSHVESVDRLWYGRRDRRERYRWFPPVWDMAKEEGLEIPGAYISVVKKQDRFAANPSTFRYLQKYPDLEKVSGFEPVWGILKLTGGHPCYLTSFETPVWAREDAVEKMCELAQAFSARFEGIVWGEGQFGHDPKRLLELYKGVYDAISERLREVFDIHPVEPEC